ncbi:MAG: amidohydrolase family protein, partial [Alphaproteobacteria bacterium]|nr:amidohydrolase family protein [Alphaproteobacteria bacterium]
LAQWWAVAAAWADELPIFDTHVHYSYPAWREYPPTQVIELLRRNGVPRALVSSSPDDGTVMLYEQDPERVLPVLRPYHGQVSPGNWFDAAAVPGYLEGRLRRPIYHGIGEFHLYDPENADAEVVRRTIEMANRRGLFLHVHSDAEAVRRIFALAPKSRILWAHAGLSEPPAVIDEMLARYPNLSTEISIREQEIAPGGVLDPTWRALFLRYADRLMIGSDTYVNWRWRNYTSIMAFNRAWLKQLPEEVAAAIAHGNARRLFGRTSR